jgi:hypothetical protein
VLDALGDSEMRWLNQGAQWLAVNEASAYGWTPAVTIRMAPTSREVSQAEIVASWLAWLGMTEGPKAVPRLVSWAHDEPKWRMAAKEKCSERTVANRIDRSVAAILGQFGGVQVDIAEVNEGPEKPVGHFSSPVFATHVGARDGGHAVVWIDGIGPMKDYRRVTNWAPLGETKRMRA